MKDYKQICLKYNPSNVNKPQPSKSEAGYLRSASAQPLIYNVNDPICVKRRLYGGQAAAASSRFITAKQIMSLTQPAIDRPGGRVGGGGGEVKYCLALVG